MYELIQAGAQSYYIQCPAKIGVYCPDGASVWLIDSGGDKDAGRRVKKLLAQQGWELKGILNTHSNADHIGGNRYLQSQFHCPVYAPGLEASFTKYPALEPSFLYGGYPFRDLRHKFLMAEPSDAAELTPAVLPEGVELIPLPGHFFDMAGFRLPDGAVFLADCLSSAATLEKYQISFIYDVAAYLDTLERITTLEGNLFVPAHADAVRDVRPLAELNRSKVLEIAGRIKAICTQPTGFEAVLQRLFQDYGLEMTFEQYVLVGSTVRSYLSWLKDLGEIEGYFENQCLLWKTV